MQASQNPSFKPFYLLVWLYHQQPQQWFHHFTQRPWSHDLYNDTQWDTHYDLIIFKAYKTQHFIRRSVSNSHSSHTKLKLHTSLVRPILMYCSQVWRPHKLKDTKCFETVQRRATKYILHDSITQLIKSVSSPSISIMVRIPGYIAYKIHLINILIFTTMSNLSPLILAPLHLLSSNVLCLDHPTTRSTSSTSTEWWNSGIPCLLYLFLPSKKLKLFLWEHHSIYHFLVLGLFPALVLTVPPCLPVWISPFFFVFQDTHRPCVYSISILLSLFLIRALSLQVMKKISNEIKRM